MGKSQFLFTQFWAPMFRLSLITKKVPFIIFIQKNLRIALCDTLRDVKLSGKMLAVNINEENCVFIVVGLEVLYH